MSTALPDGRFLLPTREQIRDRTTRALARCLTLVGGIVGGLAFAVALAPALARAHSGERVLGASALGLATTTLLGYLALRLVRVGPPAETTKIVGRAVLAATLNPSAFFALWCGPDIVAQLARAPMDDARPFLALALVSMLAACAAAPVGFAYGCAHALAFSFLARELRQTTWASLDRAHVIGLVSVGASASICGALACVTKPASIALPLALIGLAAVAAPELTALLRLAARRRAIVRGLRSRAWDDLAHVPVEATDVPEDLVPLAPGGALRAIVPKRAASTYRESARPTALALVPAALLAERDASPRQARRAR